MAIEPGAQEQNMGPNLAAVQSLLDATRDMSGGEAQENDKSALAIALAVTATPTQALKSDVVASLLGNVDRAVVSLGANITPQVSIFSPTKGTSVFFGFPILFDSIAHGGAGDEGGDVYGGGGEGGGFSGEGDEGHYLDAKDDPRLFDPWSFHEYPYSDEAISHASQGMDGVSHERGVDMYHDLSPSASPDVRPEHSEGRGV
ncbi:hypothetical protein ACIS_00634 [Anaplasma centrale str. Israel]|uniref:Uncharacterized protein n=1 Tax=Anaplasma centrale (strain Israel) TaxID=574556 RepID=D1AUI9_ANACI|nr:hypothetical protein [Anaplasma centrale]ACZ49217.1 hypothetical protein ACIS_00634 [Anaplasma centrale str. Israel]